MTGPQKSNNPVLISKILLWLTMIQTLTFLTVLIPMI